MIESAVGALRLVFSLFVEGSKFELDKLIKKHEEQERIARIQRKEKMSSKLTVVRLSETAQSLMENSSLTSPKSPPHKDLFRATGMSGSEEVIDEAKELELEGN